MARSVVVVGAGVLGISTALRLVAHGFKVTIVARDWSPSTTSDVAAAFWGSLASGNTPQSVMRGWLNSTLSWYKAVLDSGAGPAAGIAVYSGIRLFDEPQPDRTPWSDALQAHGFPFRKTVASELKRGDHEYKDGYVHDIPMVDTTVYLAWLLNAFKHHGGTCVRQTISSFSQLRSEFPADAYVNCTGLFGKSLVSTTAPDNRASDCMPMRGQLIHVYAPHVTTFLDDEDGFTYIFPRGNGVVVCGGCCQAGRYDLAVDAHDEEDIWKRCVQVMPALGDPSVKKVRSVVGLRPTRAEGVRVESELVQGVPVIHNYGHGGGGVSMSWGCSALAAQLVSQALREPISTLIDGAEMVKLVNVPFRPEGSSIPYAPLLDRRGPMTLKVEMRAKL